MDWSTLTNNVLGFMYLFPEGARELKVKPGRSGAGIRAASLAAIPLRRGSLAGIMFADPLIGSPVAGSKP